MMLLSRQNIKSYAKQQLLHEEVADIEERDSPRSKFFIINQKYIFKNMKFNDPAEVSRFKNELAFLRYVTPMKIGFAPKLFFSDPYFNIICTEYFKENTYFTEKWIATFAEIFLAYTSLEFRTEKSYLPWIFDKNARVIQNLYISDETANLVQSCKYLYKFECLVHGDLKFDNVLISNKEIKIIDWEFCGIGDPVWDATYLLASLFIKKVKSELHIIVDTVSDELFDLFLDVNKHQLHFIIDMYNLLRLHLKTDSNKFIVFFGLGIFKRVAESYQKDDTRDKFLLSLSKSIIASPDRFKDLLK